MANVKINGVSYNNVPSVQIPNASGSGNAVFFDASTATRRRRIIFSIPALR